MGMKDEDSGTAPALEVVVITYRSWATADSELTQMCELARSLSYVLWHFIDNSSGEDANRLRSATADLSNVRVTELNNPGFAASCNHAVEQSSARWILLLNPDVMISHENLQAVFAACEGRANRTVAVSMVTHGITHAGVALRYGSWFVDANCDAGEKVIGPSGGAGLYPRATYRAFGGLYEPLFAWGEDADLAWRLHRRGVPCDVLDLQLPHQGGHSVGSSVEANQFKVRSLYRNRMIVARRNLSTFNFFAFAAIYAVALTLLAVKNSKRRALAASFEGYAQGLRISMTIGRIA